jgi:hypothetical protein
VQHHTQPNTELPGGRHCAVDIAVLSGSGSLPDL